MKKPKGVFCLEGDWWNDPRKPSTVEPILELLAKADGIQIRYVHLNVGNRDSFNDYLSKWTQKRFQSYPILYLAFHGNPGEIQVGDSRRPSNTVKLTDLGDSLAGKCKGRIIFFGSCETVDVHGKLLNSFLKKTGALAVCGYCGSVDWVLSTAFELIALASMRENALTISGAKAFRRKILQKMNTTAKELRFRMVVRANS